MPTGTKSLARGVTDTERMEPSVLIRDIRRQIAFQPQGIGGRHAKMGQRSERMNGVEISSQSRATIVWEGANSVFTGLASRNPTRFLS